MQLMSIHRAALSLVLCLACGGTDDEPLLPPPGDGGVNPEGPGAEAGVPGEGSADAGPDGAPQPPTYVPATGLDVESSGARLGVRLLSADGLQFPVGWTDLQRSQSCRIQALGTPAVPTCVPLATPAYASGTFSGADCAASSTLYRSQLVLSTTVAGLCETAHLYEVPIAPAPTRQLQAPGAAHPDGAACYRSLGGTCSAEPFSCSGFALGAVVSPAELVAGVSAVEPETPGIVVTRFGDGARAFESWHDGVEACLPAPGADGLQHCLPHRYETKSYLDALCTSPVYVAADPLQPPRFIESVGQSACGQPAARTAVAAVPHPEAAAATPLQLFGKNAEGQCVSGGRVNADRVFSPGAVLPSTATPTMESAVLEGPRLRATFVQASGFKRSTGFYDKELGLACEFRDQGTSGGVRCMPTERTVPESDPRTFYTDAACSSTVRLTHYVAPATCGGPPPLLMETSVSSAVCDRRSSYWRLGPAPSQLFTMAEGACVPAPVNPAEYLARGDVLGPTSFVAGVVAP